MIGKIINNFEIIELLGKGGMGTVYLARDTMLDRKVAIKMLHPELLHQKDVLTRFQSEAKTLANLNHPNVAILYNLIVHENNYFMVMEYVAGDSFEEIINKKGAIEAKESIELVLQGLEGIKHAHSRKIIHRDLKPANLMINERGKVKVMDFGIARMLGSSRMTQAGRVVGTLEYMAPEQIKGNEGDERTDIYSMGVVLFELLTGNVPFKSKSDYDLMTMKLNEPPPNIGSYLHKIPNSLDKIILKALSRDPQNRYQTATEFQKALKNCLKKYQSAAFVSQGSHQVSKTPVLNTKRGFEFSNLTQPLLKNSKKILVSILFLICVGILGFSTHHLRKARIAKKQAALLQIDKNDYHDQNQEIANNNVIPNYNNSNGFSGYSKPNTQDKPPSIDDIEFEDNVEKKEKENKNDLRNENVEEKSTSGQSNEKQEEIVIINEGEENNEEDDKKSSGDVNNNYSDNVNENEEQNEKENEEALKREYDRLLLIEKQKEVEKRKQEREEAKRKKAIEDRKREKMAKEKRDREKLEKEKRDREKREREKQDREKREREKIEEEKREKNKTKNKSKKAYTVKVSKSTKVNIYLNKALSSQDKNMNGRIIYLYTKDPIIVNGIMAIPKGSSVYCKVNEIQSASGRKKGVIELEAKEIIVDGKIREKIPLKDARFIYEGKKGENVVFKKGQTFIVKVASSKTITVYQ